MSTGFVVGWNHITRRGLSTRMSMRNAVVVPATGRHSATVMFLHGLGDTGQGWAPVVPMLRQSHIKFILPTAPTRSVTLNGGMPMPAWTDVFGLDVASKEDEGGFTEAVENLSNIISAEVEAGIPPERIIVGGFSQGGAVALTAHLRLRKKIAGTIVLSSWLPLRKSYPNAFSEANQTTPILMCHGDEDKVVPFQWGEMSSKALIEMNLPVDFRTIPMLDHGVDPDELNIVQEFIAKRLPSDLL